jgi:DNA-binding transcriptional LysR family regulator
MAKDGIQREETLLARLDAAGIGINRAGIDLNLLVYLEALYTEGGVSRAAERVNLSQPAMSLALKRLREIFDDPLLIRTPRGMVPTQRAQELIEPVRAILGQSRDLLGGRRKFDPATAAGPFTLVGTEYVFSILLPTLIKRLEREAPLASIVSRPTSPIYLKSWFEEGRVGLGIGYSEQPPQELRVRPLFDESLVCIARRKHSKIRGTLSLDQFCAFPHVAVRPMGTPQYALSLESALAALDREIKIGLLVSDFLIAPEVVAETDMIALVPRGLAQRYAGPKALQILMPPVALPKLHFSMIWHERTHRDPVYQWLRDVVADASRELAPRDPESGV